MQKGNTRSKNEMNKKIRLSFFTESIVRATNANFWNIICMQIIDGAEVPYNILKIAICKSNVFM